MNDAEIKRQIEIREAANVRAKEMNKYEIQIGEQKKSAISIIKEYGYSSTSDIQKIVQEEKDLENEVIEEGKEAESYIIETNPIKQELDVLLMRN